MGIFVLLIVVCVVKSEGKNYEELNFSTLPNVYMEYLGDVRFFHETYNIVSYFNLDELSFQESELLRSINKVDSICQNNCTETRLILRLKSQLESIRQDKYKLFSALGVPNLIRNKRGIFDFVGKITKILFGTMSQDDADYYNSEIDAVHKDNKRIGELFKNQTYVLQLTLHKTESIFREYDKKFTDINSNFQNFDENMQLIVEQEKLLQENTLITEMCLELELGLIEFSRNVNMFTQCITFAKMGQVNPQLLTPELLMSSIKLIQNERGANEMPIVLHDGNYFEYLEISEVTISVVEYRFIYLIKVPLLELGNYKAYRIIPAPKILHQNLAIYISNPHDYIITNNEKLLYTPSDEHFLENCKNHKLVYFCKTVHPKYYIQKHDSCLSKIINDPSKLDKNDCDLKVITMQHTAWIQLKNGHEWLYSAPIPETIKIICGDVIENELINGTKLLRIAPGCNALTNDVILNSYIERNNDNNKAFIPLITYNFSEHFQVLEDPSLNFSLIKIHPIATPDIKLSDLTKYGTTLTEIRREAIEIGNHERTKTTYEKAISWISYILYGLGVVVILYIIVKLKLYQILKNMITGIYNCCKKGKKLSPQNSNNVQTFNQEFVKNGISMNDLINAYSISSNLNLPPAIETNKQFALNKNHRSKFQLSEFEDLS